MVFSYALKKKATLPENNKRTYTNTNTMVYIFITEFEK